MPEPLDALLLPVEHLKLSRERLRMALLARVPAEAAPKPPGAIAEAMGKVKRALPGGEAVVEAAREHRVALVIGGVALAVLIARPWRLLLKPKVLVTIAVPLAAYGVKKVPMRVWMNLAASLARMVWARRRRRRVCARERRHRAGRSEFADARATIQRVRAGTGGKAVDAGGDRFSA